MTSENDLLHRWAAFTDPEHDPITAEEVLEHAKVTPIGLGTVEPPKRRLALAVMSVVLLLAGSAVAIGVTRRSDDRNAVARESTPSSMPPIRQELIEGIPVLSGYAHAPGTPISDGLRVPNGTYLLGEAVPVPPEPRTEYSPGTARSWNASLIVTGSVAAPISDLSGQLRSMGHSVTHHCDRGYGSDRTDRSDDTLRCTISAGRVTDSGSEELLNATLSRSQRSSHLDLDFRANNPDPRFGGVPPFDLGVERISDLPGPKLWPDLPQVGDPLNLGARGAQRSWVRALRLLPGTRTLGPPDPSFKVTLVVDTDPAAALAGYVSQALEAIGDNGVRHRYEDSVEGGQITTEHVNEGGDDVSIAFRTVVRRGHPTWLTISWLTS